ncbi:MAG: hypothetical protein K0R27_5308, partial [Xanthobacteraceae bacterium]|nr:hypothetical protein [Xanthobacteraceae bacterium]
MRALFAALIIAAAPLGGFAPPALAQSAAPAAPDEKSLPGEK